MNITTDTIEAATMGIGLSKDHQKFKNELHEKFGKDTKIIPFYKDNGTKMPAGYVIETPDYTDEKGEFHKGQVMVCYHGTKFSKIFGDGAKEAYHDMQTQPTDMKFGNETYEVHKGFKTEYESSKASLYQALCKVDPTKEVVFAGHSLGGAVANLAALDAKTNGSGIKIGAVITCGAPPVFSQKAAEKFHQLELNDKSFRVEQIYDPIPRLLQGTYEHVGKQIRIHAGTMAVHGSNVYNKLSKKLNQDHLDKAKPSKAMIAQQTSEVGYNEEVRKLPRVTLYSMAIKQANKMRDKFNKYYNEAQNYVKSNTLHSQTNAKAR